MVVLIGPRKMKEKIHKKLLGLKKYEIIENCGHFSFLENQKKFLR